jgi:predicted Zn-dependent protease
MARIRARQGETEPARDLLNTYLTVTGEQGTPEELLLPMLEEAGRYREAALLHLESAAHNPEKLRVWAEALLEEGRADKAAVYLDHYLQARPLDGDGLALFAKCLKDLPGEGEGHKDAYRRMHIAYALDWIEAGDWNQAERSVRAARRYATSPGDADLLDAVIAESKGDRFVPPGEWVKPTRAVMQRLADLAAAGKLPEDASRYMKDSVK